MTYHTGMCPIVSPQERSFLEVLFMSTAKDSKTKPRKGKIPANTPQRQLNKREKDNFIKNAKFTPRAKTFTPPKMKINQSPKPISPHTKEDQGIYIIHPTYMDD